MSDAVELMEFWPVDADENIGFVAADSDFQLWLLDGIGISFDDISYSVIDGPDNSGIYELVLDYEDYTTLNELYASYLGDNEYASEEGQSPIMDPMDFGEPVNWTPLDGTPSLKRRKDAEDEPLFKTQKEIDEHKQWLKESKEKFPKGEVRVVGRDKIDKRSALGKMMSRWDAEGANPSGGATGDQIISWEHNGLSSPSGPPSDIFWSEGSDIRLDAECAAGKEYVQIFDTTITKNGIDVKLWKAGIKPIDVFVLDDIGGFGVYLQPWDVTAFSKEFNKKDWNGLFEFEAEGFGAESDNFIWCAYCDDLITDDYYFTDGKTVHVDCNLKDSGDAETFDAHSLHRFTQKDSRPMDIGITRQKIKKEMFSEVSSFMTLKNLAVLTAAGMAGYLIAGRK